MREAPTFEDALTFAEAACNDEICRLLNLRSGIDGTISISNGQADGTVFDMGYGHIGIVTTFPSTAYCFRASLDLFNRDRAKLQRWIMSLLRAYPSNQNHAADSNLRETSNVLHFRLAPEDNYISEITTFDAEPKQGGRKVPTFTATALFDVVFAAPRPEQENEGMGGSGPIDDTGGEGSDGHSTGGDSGGEGDVPEE